MSLSSLWKFYSKWTVAIVPPVMLLLFLALPVVEWAKPWNEARRKFEGEFMICVGVGSESTGNSKLKQGSYLIPSQTSLATVVEKESGEGALVEVRSSRAGFWMLILVIVALVFTAFRYSLPILTSLGTKSIRAEQGVPAKSDRSGG